MPYMIVVIASCPVGQTNFLRGLDCPENKGGCNSITLFGNEIRTCYPKL